MPSFTFFCSSDLADHCAEELKRESDNQLFLKVGEACFCVLREPHRAGDIYFLSLTMSELLKQLKDLSCCPPPEADTLWTTVMNFESSSTFVMVLICVVLLSPQINKRQVNCTEYWSLIFHITTISRLGASFLGSSCLLKCYLVARQPCSMTKSPHLRARSVFLRISSCIINCSVKVKKRSLG